MLWIIQNNQNIETFFVALKTVFDLLKLSNIEKMCIHVKLIPFLWYNELLKWYFFLNVEFFWFWAAFFISVKQNIINLWGLLHEICHFAIHFSSKTWYNIILITNDVVVQCRIINDKMTKSTLVSKQSS